ncbi:MAG: cryptochrome/photolyase family protein [Puniceicoccales bacterium]
MPNTTSTTLVWFRRDLRISDNAALKAAIERGAPIVPVYIFDEAGEGEWAPGGASKWWLHHALKDLAETLEASNFRLVLRQGKSQAELAKLIDETGADAVYWNRRYEPAIIERDKRIKDDLSSNDIEARSFNSSLAFEPWEVKNKTGAPYKVFTPFWKELQRRDFAPPVEVDLNKGEPCKSWPESLDLDALQLLPDISWDSGFYEAWTPTIAAAKQRLGKFAANGGGGYASDRDRPDLDATSRLSPYLHFGQVGPREVFHAFKEHGVDKQKSARVFLSEIAWREFSYHLIYHFPHTPKDPLRKEFEHFPWEMNEAFLRAWQKGQTGYPIVDAGMRQLWATGWMHNRVRMVVASLLVKHLQLPWQEGARWFWDTLVDADLANNTQGWQWSAGCGADAAPYFRVFNPILQGKKFDPEGSYVREWVPELRKLPDSVIHAPWEADASTLRAAGVELGDDYPHPIIDHQKGRNRALQAYEKLKALRSD